MPGKGSGNVDGALADQLRMHLNMTVPVELTHHLLPC